MIRKRVGGSKIGGFEGWKLGGMAKTGKRRDGKSKSWRVGKERGRSFEL